MLPGFTHRQNVRNFYEGIMALFNCLYKLKTDSRCYLFQDAPIYSQMSHVQYITQPLLTAISLLINQNSALAELSVYLLCCVKVYPSLSTTLHTA